MKILEENEKYQLFTFIAACRVWYAVRRIKDDEIVYCNNSYENVLKTFNQKSSKSK